MKTLNLKELKVFTDAYKERYVTIDVSRDFANYLYNQIPYNPVISSVIERIIGSEGIIEIGETDENAIISALSSGIEERPRDGILIALHEEELRTKVAELSLQMSEEEATIKVMKDILTEAKRASQK